MTETPTRRGRPRGVESQHVMVRMPVDLIAQIDAYAESIQKQIAIGDVNISRGMAIRELVKRGLQSVQATPPALISRPPMPMAAPVPPMAVPQAPEPHHLASMADVERTTETPAHRSQRGLPREKLQEIADERIQCEGLSLRDFSKRLFDKSIYRGKGDKPAEAGWLSRQLKKAQDEGML